MKSAHELLNAKPGKTLKTPPANTDQSTTSTRTPRSDDERLEMGKRVVVDFFARMGRIYGHKWRSQYPDEQSARLGMAEWLETFQEARLTRRMIERGIRASKQLEEWPPSHKRFVDLAIERPDESRRPLNASHRVFERSTAIEKKLTPEEIDERRAKIAALRALLKTNANSNEE